MLVIVVQVVEEDARLFLRGLQVILFNFVLPLVSRDEVLRRK
jgi:hypothetical protein